MKDKLKNMFSGKRKNENLVLLLVLIVVVVISINYICKDDKKTNQQSNDINKNDAVEVCSQNSDNSTDLEKRLEDILSKIAGVGDTRVMITYAESSSVEPIYDENTKLSNTVESDDSGGTRSITETNKQKQVVYRQNSDGSKEPITKSSTSPKIEGAIVTAKGANNDEVKEKIIEAIEAATGISPHKIQVFEMK